MKDISTSIPKMDADDKISGRALYVDDYPFDDLYHAKTLRSTKAKAKIKNIHIPELPDDYFVVDKFDVPHSNVVGVSPGINIIDCPKNKVMTLKKNGTKSKRIMKKRFSAARSNISASIPKSPAMKMKTPEDDIAVTK